MPGAIDDLAYQPAGPVGRDDFVSHLWVAALQGYQPAIAELARRGISVADYQAKAKAAGMDYPQPAAEGGPGAERAASQVLAQALAGPDLPIPPQRPAMPPRSMSITRLPPDMIAPRVGPMMQMGRQIVGEPMNLTPWYKKPERARKRGSNR